MLLLMVLLVIYAYHGITWSSFWPMLKRLRWFFLSIVVVYWWFTPGIPVISYDHVLVPSEEGVIEGMIHLVVLVMLVAGVHLLLSTTPKPSLMAALLWLLRPLKIFGLTTDKLALRMTLTLEAADKLRSLPPHDFPRQSSHWLTAVATRCTAAVNEVIRQAKAAPLIPYTIPSIQSPPLLQWVYPVSFLLFFAGF